MAKWNPEHGKDLVCVHWKDADASAPADGFYESDIAAGHKTTPVLTYGLLLKEDEEGVTLMTETYVDDNGRRVWRGKTFIPGPMVDAVQTLLTARRQSSSVSVRAAKRTSPSSVRPPASASSPAGDSPQGTDDRP